MIRIECKIVYLVEFKSFKMDLHNIVISYRILNICDSGVFLTIIELISDKSLELI